MRLSEADDELQVAIQVGVKFMNDLGGLAGAGAEAINALHVEYNVVIVKLAEQSLKRAVTHKRELHVERAIMNALLEVPAMVPVLGDEELLEFAFKARAQVAPVAGVKEQIRDFLLSRSTPEEQTAAETAVNKFESTTRAAA